jgi:hypothetical protein
MDILRKNVNTPESMLQVIAWVIGEYGSNLESSSKINEILEELTKVAEMQLEDEFTRGYVLSAITKIQCANNFADNVHVDNVIRRYCKSKNVDS